jgi:hypothetical protein
MKQGGYMKKLIAVMVMMFSFNLFAFTGFENTIILTVGMSNSPWKTPYNSYSNGVITEICPVNDKVCKVTFGNITEYLKIGDLLAIDGTVPRYYKIESFDYNIVQLVKVQSSR